jgi:hypothetical protein
MSNLFSKLFKNKNGEIVVAQRPNLLLYVWIIALLLSKIIGNPEIQNGFRFVAGAALFAWSYLEITQGDNTFRRILGLVVMCAVILGFFRS